MSWGRVLSALGLLLTITVTVNCGGDGDSGNPNTTTLSGRVVAPDGSGVAGVTITASGIPGIPGCTTVTRSTVTGADGSFVISETPPFGGSGTATIVASSPNHEFTPVTQTLGVSAGGSYTVNFTAFRVHDVGGTIRDTGGALLQGLTVSLSGSDSRTTTTGSDGTYKFAKVLAGNLTITPVHLSFTFSPPQIQLTLAADSAGNDFVGTYIPRNLSGTVKVGSTPVPGATITISGPLNALATTDSQGTYSFTALPRGSYTVGLETTGYAKQFAPVSMDERDEVRDFSAVPLSNSIFGRITGPNGLGLPGATVTASDGFTTATATTNASGDFILGPLPTPIGGAYALVPSTSCPTYNFTPGMRSVPMAGANVTGADFTAAFSGPGTNSVSGQVTRAGAGVAGITVAASGMEQVSAVTAADGTFLLQNLHNGAFSVAPSSSGLRFSPASRNVDLCQQSQTGVDFAENFNWSRATHVEGIQRAIVQATNGAISVGDRFTILGLDPYGDTAWAIRSTAPSDAAHAVAQAADGSFFVAGKTIAGSSDGFPDGHVVKITASGSILWQTSFGGPGEDVARSVAATADGGALVAGTSGGSMFLMKLDSAGGVTWQKTYGGYLPLMVRVDAAGYTIAAGRGSVGNLLVLQVDVQGAVLSSQQFSETQPGTKASALSAVATEDGGIAFGGQLGTAAWAMKVSPANAIVWQRSVTGGAKLGEAGNAVLEQPGGAIVVAGARRLAPNDGNAFLLFFDAKGVPQKLNAYGQTFPLRREAVGASKTADGRIELTGSASFFGTWSWAGMINGDGTTTGCPNVFNLPMTTSDSALAAIMGSVSGTDLALPVRAGQMVVQATGKTLNNECY